MNDKLLSAAAAGNLNQVNSLLAKGADPNIRDEYGYTPLILAASEGRSDMVRQLIDKGADVNARTASNWTALLWASSMGYSDVVKLLLERGADPEAKDQVRRHFLNEGFQKRPHRSGAASS